MTYEGATTSDPAPNPAILSKQFLRLSFKSAFDTVFCLFAIFLLSPLLILIAILVRLDSPGPVIFRQSRTGLNGRTFSIFKFRTMRVLEDGAVIQQVQRGDSRVTRIGRVLRSTSMDELPQLFNVLRGEMALVGPRPHATAHDAHFGREISTYNRRFSVKPGLTGWAQINGSRGETPTTAHMIARVELDLWYIENQSPAIDTKILLKTIAMELSRRNGAY